MTIFDADWRRQFIAHVQPRLGVAHPDLTRIAAKLRDGLNVDVWTESPSDDSKLTAGKEHYSLEGWRAFYKTEYTHLNQWNTDHGTKLGNWDSQAKTALDGYLASMPNIAVVMNDIIANYKDTDGNVIQTTVSQADRDTLAAAIEAELQ